MFVRMLLLSKVIIRLVYQNTSMLFSAKHIQIRRADALAIDLIIRCCLLLNTSSCSVDTCFFHIIYYIKYML